jgi:hypothetical protein
MKWLGRLLLVGFFASLLAAGTAHAQVVSGDPNPGSPPRAVYELPLDVARKDAAPRAKGSGKKSGKSGSSSSGFRSENNFGSSAIVPGDPRGGGGGDAAAGAGAAAAGAAGAAAAGADDSGLAPAATSLDTGDPSESSAFLLLGLILVVGVLLGLPSARTRNSDS